MSLMLGWRLALAACTEQTASVAFVARDITSLLCWLDTQVLAHRAHHPSARHPFAVRPSEIINCLAEHRVEYVLIGGLAAMIHGWTGPTPDVDITPEPQAANLQRLSAAIQALLAQRLTEMATALADSVGNVSWTIPSDLGLDFIFEPFQPKPRGTTTRATPTRDRSGSGLEGAEGYAKLCSGASSFRSRFGRVRVASLDDIVRIKAIAARPKDQQVVVELRSLEAKPQ